MNMILVNEHVQNENKYEVKYSFLFKYSKLWVLSIMKRKLKVNEKKRPSVKQNFPCIIWLEFMNF